MPDSQIYLLAVSLEIRPPEERKKFDAALFEFAKEDPYLCILADDVSGQITIQGTSETQINSLISRTIHKSKVIPFVGAPQVSYRETITMDSKIDYTHEETPDRPESKARIEMRLEPLLSGAGFEFKNDITDKKVPENCLDNIEQGIKGALVDGVVGGFPVVDLCVKLTSFVCHENNSKVLTTAARAAVRKGLLKAAPTLLEPIMLMVVDTPEEYSNSIIGDLNLRRGQVNSIDNRGNTKTISVIVPFTTLFGYSNTLKGLSHGQADFKMQFDHYAPVPVPEGDPPRRPAMIMRG